MEEIPDRFIVLVFPGEKSDKKQLADLATRFVSELRKACGESPHLIRPDATALCMLAYGTYAKISRAVQEASALDTRALIACVSGPHECIGLATTHSWLVNRDS